MIFIASILACTAVVVVERTSSKWREERAFKKGVLHGTWATITHFATEHPPKR